MPSERIPTPIETPIKHSQGGEMPDISNQARLINRLRADASILPSKLAQTPRIYWIMGGLVTVLLSGLLYRLSKRAE